MGERELRCNWELGFLRVFLCTIVFSLIIVKSLQLRGRRQIAEPRKYCLVCVIVFFDVCFLYLFCFSQVRNFWLNSLQMTWLTWNSCIKVSEGFNTIFNYRHHREEHCTLGEAATTLCVSRILYQIVSFKTLEI